MANKGDFCIRSGDKTKVIRIPSFTVVGIPFNIAIGI